MNLLRAALLATWLELRSRYHELRFDAAERAMDRHHAGLIACGRIADRLEAAVAPNIPGLSARREFRGRPVEDVHLPEQEANT